MDADGASIQMLRRKIGELPQDLYDLYDSLLCSPISYSHAQTVRLFRWICFAVRPLTVLEIQHALAMDPDRNVTSIEQFRKSEEYREDLDDVVETIKALSRGLAEAKLIEDSIPANVDFTPEEYVPEDYVTVGYILNEYAFKGYTFEEYESEESGSEIRGSDDSIHSTCTRTRTWENIKVQLIHQSVLDFFRDTWLCGIGSTGLPHSSSISSNFVLSRSCIRYALMEEVREAAYQRPSQLPIVTNALPMLKYCLQYLPLHLRNLEADSFDQPDLLDLFSWPENERVFADYAKLDEILSLRSPEHRSPSFLHFICGLGLQTTL